MGRLTKWLNDKKQLCIEVCEKECTDGYRICPKCNPLRNVFIKLAEYEDLEEQGLLLKLPCKVGDKLYKITYPYRQHAKVTEFTVRNFRTVKKGQKLQIEVQANGVPMMNWMYFEDFYTDKAEAEKALEEMEK